MQIVKAPEGLSNTKLMPYAKIKEELCGKKTNVKIRPHSIHKKLAEHEIFQNFAYSNQALCKKLREFYKEVPSESDLEGKLKSLENKISYNAPTDNNLLECLSNLLLYKGLILDIMEQIPREELGKYKKSIDEHKKSLDEYDKIIEKHETNTGTHSTNLDILAGKKNVLDESEKKFDEYKGNYQDYEKRKKVLKDELTKQRIKCNEIENERDKSELKYKNFEENKSKYVGSEDYNEKLSKSKAEYEELKRKYKEADDEYDKLRDKFESKDIDSEEQYNKSRDECKEEYEEDKIAYDKLVDKCKKSEDECKKTEEEYEKTRVKHEKASEQYNKSVKEYKSLDEYKILNECEKLDYKVSVHIRFTRTMNALNAYTEENFTPENFGKPQEAFQETGISDEYGWKIIKHKNLMKFARQKINRYVTWQKGGIYTTVVRDEKQAERDYERTKFRYLHKVTSTDKVESKPIWDCKEHQTEATYTLKQRIKDSCENFKKLIDEKVISTYANYYGVDNVVRLGEDKRLYLNYVYDPEEKKLEIPRYVDHDNEKKEAPLHTVTSAGRGKKFENLIYNPEISGGFSYDVIPYNNRAGSFDDILGLLYAIRKNKLAVSFTDTDEGFHSSMWSGKKVQSAGLLAAWNGKLVVVDNLSGHYQPNWYLMYMAWKPFYEKGVFHKDAILGIGAYMETNHKFISQFFKVTAFMRLAKTDLKIGETVRELECHIKEMSEIKKFEVTDQSQYQECDNVLMTPFVERYYRVWPHEDPRKKLACAFIMTMEYPWDRIVLDARKTYQVFLGKKRTLLPRKNNLEKILNNRTKEVKKSLKKVNPEVRDFLTEQEDEREKELKAAIDNYKEVLSKIESDSQKTEKLQKEADKLKVEVDKAEKIEDEEHRKLVLKRRTDEHEKAVLEVTQSKPKDIEKYNLIKCITDIYYANDAYSKLAVAVAGDDHKKINNYQAKIGDWVFSLQLILGLKANRKAGLGEEEIYLSRKEQSKAAKKFIQESMGTTDHLGNYVDLSSEVEDEDKDKRLLLVDSSILKKQPPRQQQPPPEQQQQPEQPPPLPSKSDRSKYVIKCNHENCHCSGFRENVWKPGSLICSDCSHQKGDHVLTRV